MDEREYIDKAALEKFIQDGLNNPDKSKAFGYDAIEILTEIHYTPAADVAEVWHGKWVDGIYCSVCSELYDSGEYSNPRNFCPNCGAKMDKEAADV